MYKYQNMTTPIRNNVRYKTSKLILQRINYKIKQYTLEIRYSKIKQNHNKIKDHYI